VASFSQASGSRERREATRVASASRRHSGATRGPSSELRRCVREKAGRHGSGNGACSGWVGLWIEQRRTGAGFALVGQERRHEDQEPTGGDFSIPTTSSSRLPNAGACSTAKPRRHAQPGFPTRCMLNPLAIQSYPRQIPAKPRRHAQPVASARPPWGVAATLA
jgi:hypothetical protein